MRIARVVSGGRSVVSATKRAISPRRSVAAAAAAAGAAAAAVPSLPSWPKWPLPRVKKRDEDSAARLLQTAARSFLLG